MWPTLVRLGRMQSAQDYYPFGMVMPGRSFQGSDGYRYGFNGMEKDNEVKGDANSIDFGARIYDARIGRWLSVDDLTANYPSLSPYQYVGNSPLIAVDLDGKEIIIVGSPEFVRRVKVHLAALRTTKKGAEMIKFLHEESSMSIVIREGNGDILESGYDAGTGRLYIGTNSSVGFAEYTYFNELIVLAHELDHVRRHGKFYGFRSLSEAEQKRDRYDFEYSAVKFENYVRDVFGWFSRRHFYTGEFSFKFYDSDEYNPDNEEVEITKINIDKWELVRVPLIEEPVPLGSESDGTQGYMEVWVKTTPEVRYKTNDQNNNDSPEEKSFKPNEYKTHETNRKAVIPGK